MGQSGEEDMKSRPELAMKFLQDGEEWQSYKAGCLLRLGKFDGLFHIILINQITRYRDQKVFSQYELSQRRSFNIDYEIEQLWLRVRAGRRSNKP